MSVIKIKEDENVEEEPPLSKDIQTKLDKLQSEVDKNKSDIKEQLKVMK